MLSKRNCILLWETIVIGRRIHDLSALFHNQKCTVLSLIRKNILFIVFLLAPGIIFSQTRISASTNFIILRSFKKDQRFWAVGQDIFVDWHFTNKGGAYVSLSYSSNGKFTNQLSADAKALTT